MHKYHLCVHFHWVLCKENKKPDGACRAACAAGEMVVVLDNISLLLRAVKVITSSVARSYVYTHGEGDITKMGDTDDTDRSMGSETLEVE